jgi:hypothetical protein
VIVTGRNVTEVDSVARNETIVDSVARRFTKIDSVQRNDTEADTAAVRDFEADSETKAGVVPDISTDGHHSTWTNLLISLLFLDS